MGAAAAGLRVHLGRAAHTRAREEALGSSGDREW